MYRDTGYGSEGNFITTNTYDLRDLAHAYLEMKKSQSCRDHEDLVNYKVAKHDALSKALEVEVDSSVGFGNFFLGSMETTYNNLWDPFGISLEGPGPIHVQQFKARHNIVPGLIRTLESALVSMLTDSLISAAGGNKTVTEDELFTAGLPKKAPDKWDYF